MTINIVVIITFVLLGALQLHLDKKEEKRHKEAAQNYKEFQGAIKDFTNAVEKLEVDTTELESMKRWMKGTINQLCDHGEKLEAHLTQFEDMTAVEEDKQLTMSELVDDMMKGGK